MDKEVAARIDQMLGKMTPEQKKRLIRLLNQEKKRRNASKAKKNVSA